MRTYKHTNYSHVRRIRIIRSFALYMLKIIKNNLGTTLLEMMVAVAIFAVAMLLATGIFIVVLEGQRSAISSQNIQESARYALETIAKELRQAQASDGVCAPLFNPEPTPVYKIFNTAQAGAALYFRNKNGDCTAYFLEANRLKISRGAVSDFITPDEIRISNLKFAVKDDAIGAFHAIQPAVTLTMDIEAFGKEMHKQPMKIQTTISARYYE